MTDTPDNVVPENELTKRRLVNELAQQMAQAATIIAGSYQAYEQTNVPIKDWLPMVCEQLPEPHRSRLLTHAATAGAVAVEVLAGLITGKDVSEAMNKAMEMSFQIGMEEGSAAYRRGDPAPPWMGKIPLPPPGFLRGAGGPTILDREDGGEPDVDEGVAAARMRLMIARLFAEAPKLTDGAGNPVPDQAPALQVHVVLRGSIPPVEGVLSTTPEGGLRLMTPTEAPDTSPGARPNATKKVFLEQFFDYSDVVAVCVTRDVKATPGSRLFSS